MSQRLRALEIVLAKILPDLRSVEATVDQSITTTDATEPQHNSRQLGRAILAILSGGNEGTPPPSHADAHPLLGHLHPKKSKNSENSEIPFDTLSLLKSDDAQYPSALPIVGGTDGAERISGSSRLAGGDGVSPKAP